MKNYTDDEITQIGKDLFGSDFDGNVRTTLGKGKHTIKEIGERIAHNMGDGGYWYPVIFTDGQSCSLKTLLRCPDIRWSTNVLAGRIKALAGKELDVKKISSEHVTPVRRDAYDRKVIGLVAPIDI